MPPMRNLANAASGDGGEAGVNGLYLMNKTLRLTFRQVIYAAPTTCKIKASAKDEILSTKVLPQGQGIITEVSSLQ